MHIIKTMDRCSGCRFSKRCQFCCWRLAQLDLLALTSPDTQGFLSLRDYYYYYYYHIYIYLGPKVPIYEVHEGPSIPC